MPYDVQKVSRALVVNTFLSNEHRRIIWMQYVDFEQAMAAQQVPVLAVWLDGSFVSQKEMPKDLDIIWFIDASYLSRNYRMLDQVRN